MLKFLVKISNIISSNFGRNGENLRQVSSCTTRGVQRGRSGFWCPVCGLVLAGFSGAGVWAGR